MSSAEDALEDEVDIVSLESEQRLSSKGVRESLSQLQGLGTEMQGARTHLAGLKEDQPKYEAIVKQYERVLGERDALAQRLSEVERLYNTQAETWEQVNAQTSIEIEMMLQHNRELKDLASSHEHEITRLREDLTDLRQELRDQRLHEATYQQAITRLEQYWTCRELLTRHAHMSPQKRVAPARQKSPISPRQSVRTGRDIGVFLLQENVRARQHKETDVGRQEMRMQFLSRAGDEWAASLRTPSPPPKKDPKSLDLADLLQRDS